MLRTPSLLWGDRTNAWGERTYLSRAARLRLALVTALVLLPFNALALVGTTLVPPLAELPAAGWWAYMQRRVRAVSSVRPAPELDTPAPGEPCLRCSEYSVRRPPLEASSLCCSTFRIFVENVRRLDYNHLFW